MIYEDLKTQQISLVYIILFLLSTLLFLLESPILLSHFFSFGLITFLILGIGIIEYWKQKSLLGVGDKLLLLGCALMIPLEKLPLFLFMSGILGCLTGYLMRKNDEQDSKIPFVPAIIGSIGIIKVVEWASF